VNPKRSDIDHLKWLKLTNLDSFSGLRILDLGCGSGYICHLAMQRGAKFAVGIDVIEPEQRSQTGESWQYLNLDLNRENWHENFSDSFDLVLAFDIIEHLDSPYCFLRSCRQLLSSQGKLVLTTPNVQSWERMLKPQGWSGAQDPQHKVLFNRYSLDFLLRKAGFGTVSQSAPLRALSFLGKLQPQIGGQILSISCP
jgi:2-polyprenyl-3-methyl-5-hydroxy-6-metoxy-1,4-benzoquinol methylase